MVVTFSFRAQNIDAMDGRNMGARGCWMSTEAVPPRKYTLNPDGIMNELCLSSPCAQARVVRCKEQAVYKRRRKDMGKGSLAIVDSPKGPDLTTGHVPLPGRQLATN